jgi:hypothetical protein
VRQLRWLQVMRVSNARFEVGLAEFPVGVTAFSFGTTVGLALLM